MQIPFFLPDVGKDEIEEVVNTLRSGWLTTGPRAKQFESEFASFLGRKHAVAVNSATAALHLALDAIGLCRGESVLLPTMTFAATAEVVRYFDAKPLLVDCCEKDFNIDCRHARLVATAAIARGRSLGRSFPCILEGKSSTWMEFFSFPAILGSR